MNKTPEQEADDFATAREAKKKADLDAINDLFKAAEYLTTWETGFLSSIRSTLQRDRDLTDKQRAVLNKMVAKVAERFD